jgi:hypothetical protein
MSGGTMATKPTVLFPAGKTTDEVRPIRDDIRVRIEALLAELLSVEEGTVL